MPEYLTGIPKTFITEKYELYVIGDSAESFLLYWIDLDDYADTVNKDYRKLELKFLKEFKKDQFLNSDLADFKVRSKYTENNR